MQQYKTQYGTIFAVREYKGHPAIMLRAEHKPDDWSLSSMIEPFTPGAWTAEELQAQLDNWAAVKGWRAVEDPAGSETREIVDDEEEEIRATDSCKCRTCKCESCFAHGCAKECPANAEESCLTIGCPEYVGENEPCKTETPAPTGAAAATTDASAAVSTAETATTSESGAGANSCETPAPDAQPNKEPPAGLAPTAPMSLPAFDYTGLDGQTVADLHLAEREVSTGKRLVEIGLRRMADGVAIAHDALCGSCDIMSQLKHGNRGEASFGRWCDSVGLNRKAAERLLQVSKLFDNSCPRQQKALEELGPTLLYAAAKPSAPAELVQAVKDGDITTNKQYQDMLARYNAEKAAREQAEHEASLDRKEQEDANAAALRYKAECDRRAQDQQRLEGLVSTAQYERDTALRRATEAENRATAAENRAAGAQKLADQRGTENTDLRRKLKETESRPIDIAVAEPSEADKERWRKEGEDRMAATLQDTVLKAHKAKITAENQVADLQDENERLRIALDRPGQLDASAAMACSSCAAVLSAWFESCARDTAADLTPALARMRRLRLALDTAIEYGTWPDDAALDDLEVSEDAGC